MSAMEIKKSCMMEAISKVKIHPLVIMNISDHWTRINTQKKNVNILGALLGVQRGREIELITSFELLFEVSGDDDSEEDGGGGGINPRGSLTINMEYFEKRREQFKQVFSEMEVVGWYNLGSAPTEQHRLAHHALSKSPMSSSSGMLLLLLLDPGAASVTSDLPVTVHESIVDERDYTSFRRVSYSIETDSSERIAIEHTASSQVSESDKTQPFEVERNAIKMLGKRVKLIEAYLRAAVNRDVVADHAVVRSIVSVFRRMSLPVEDAAFYAECDEARNDVNIVALLAVLTKAGLQVDEFVGRQNTLNLKKKKVVARGKVREMMF